MSHDDILAAAEPPTADWVTISALTDDPFPIYERLRAEGGVHWVPAVGRYLVTSYEAVHETELDQEIYSANEEGSLLNRAMGHSMLRRDDPEHYAERKAWEPSLRPGLVKKVWTSTFEKNADTYLDELIARGPGADLVWDFAAPFAAENLRQMLGLYNVDQSDLQRWSQTLINAAGNYSNDPEVWAIGQKSFDEVDVALDEMLRWHADTPDDSLLSALLRVPDYEMPIERIRANIKMTIAGGLNEPRDALAVAAWALLTHPDQRAAVAADPRLWATTFEETIRWIAPIGMYSRQVTRDTVLGGVRLAAGAKLGICLLSANRDEAVWHRASEFDIHREIKPHLGFGRGVHICLGAWAARAAVANVGLPSLFERLHGFDVIPDDPAELSGWVFRGLTRLPVTWDASSAAPASRSSATQATAARLAPRVAIVGSGPAGAFTAQALLREMPGANVDVIERLPVPYGLVRYGVAADHVGTKAISRQFDRMFQSGGVRFLGNTTLGNDVHLPELRAAYDAVVLATGLHLDRPLEIAGSALAGVHGAGEISRLLNSHPDSTEIESLGSDVVIVGQGNVALDLARLIARDTAEFEGSDIDDAVRAQLAPDVQTVHLVGRSAPQDAKFDPVMVRELATLRRVAHIVHWPDIDPAAAAKDARLDAVRDLTLPANPAAEITMHWWFGLAPVALEGDGRVARARFDGPEGEVRLAADSVISAIGFAPADDAPVVPGAHAETGRVEDGLYVAGWLRRGPRGTIPDQRSDARALATVIAQDLSRRGPGSRPGIDPAPSTVLFDGWRRIDQVERNMAAPGRSRAKMRDLEQMLAAAGDESILLPSVANGSSGTSTSTTSHPITILFGSESGGAELLADELRVALESRAEVEVSDLADASPAGLSTDRLTLIICSTYGDGEVPTSARAFHQILTTERPRLDGVTYAVFGMGDRSYAKTYSRGSELLDEALAACGARRVGEYGRHDASGTIDALELAVEWVDGVLAELDAVVEI